MRGRACVNADRDEIGRAAGQSRASWRGRGLVRVHGRMPTELGEFNCAAGLKRRCVSLGVGGHV
jgi:hypothetical protein